MSIDSEFKLVGKGIENPPPTFIGIMFELETRHISGVPMQQTRTEIARYSTVSGTDQSEKIDERVANLRTEWNSAKRNYDWAQELLDLGERDYDSWFRDKLLETAIVAEVETNSGIPVRIMDPSERNSLISDKGYEAYNRIDS